MNFKTQSFFVVGISKSGMAAAEYLLKKGAKVTVYDDVKGAPEENIKKLVSLGAVAVEEPIDTADVLILSPGIPIDHPIPVSYRKQKKRIASECELAARALKATGIAVTGTNGKTTTVSLLGALLKGMGEVSVCGNVGTPFLTEADRLTEDDVAIVEISSFQLETLKSFMPHIVIVTNVTEDHLDRHYSMENYTFLKEKLLKNCTESEFAVLNYDDPIVRSFGERTKANVVWFSLNQEVDGAFMSDRVLTYRGESIASIDEMCLKGRHNLYNSLAAVAAAKLMGQSNEKIREGLLSFKGVKHRNEFVREVEGVRYVNDSKGTNVDATKKAIENCASETVLLLGGKDKGYDYDDLFSYLKKSPVVHAVLYGENRMKLVSSAIKADYNEITVCGNFSLAFSLASKIALKGQTVLLSPASASFDEFTSYEERGELFVSLVEAL